MRKLKVCHVTSVHNPFDDRIYLKECVSLEKAGYQVAILSRGEKLVKNRIQFYQCTQHRRNRVSKLFFSSYDFYRVAIKLDYDVYHFHDPELLLCAARLKKKGKVVIFDSHEDVPAQILDKEWLPRFSRKIISRLYKFYETKVVKKIDAVVCATPSIKARFENRASKIIVINNYPIIGDITFHAESFSDREASVCYIGGISENRGISVMKEAVRKLPVTLVVAGNHIQETIDLEVGKIHYIGWLNREKVNDLYAQVIAGLLLFMPQHNHFEAQPIKMFEYMAAGLPIIASDFQYWKDIIEKSNCGICVNPTDIEAIAEAIEYLCNNRDTAQEMGKNGYKLVCEKYNWRNEEFKLRELYKNFEIPM